MSLSLFKSDDKGQATHGYIALAASIVIGFLILQNFYAGTVQRYYYNSSVASIANNTTTSALLGNPPILDDAVDSNFGVRNQTGTAISECGAPPCYTITNLATGNLTFNLTGNYSSHTAAQTFYVDYSKNMLGGDGDSITTAIDTVGYAWTGMGFLALGMIALGAVYIFMQLRKL